MAAAAAAAAEAMFDGTDFERGWFQWSPQTLALLLSKLFTDGGSKKVGKEEEDANRTAAADDTNTDREILENR